MQIDHQLLIQIAKKAGDAIMKVYEDPSKFGGFETKDDRTPLTEADKHSHIIIYNSLSEYFPDIPVISEEGSEVETSVRKNWDKFWLVDPLDGTKEFINRNGEFTVNIALIEKTFPVFGLIYVPVSGVLYAGDAVKKEGYMIKNGITSRLSTSRKTDQIKAVRSRSHASPEEDAVLSRYDVAESVSAGSSLKFCLVAEGQAELYYRHGPTMEWDTAAGQAIVEAAGGKVLYANGSSRFSYNKDSLRNPSFLCLSGSLS
ncbi:MAG: 3'(2'),5'-bisphosphate nucleotidase CysQ [Cyclobacteriaceae bacterium]|nr:3'(2'),5'-bisphosphate nucleotidase CysQ [Cyclobacteriaceae bacterium]